MNNMRITIIGRGNVGTHLHKAFTEKGLECCLLDSRTLNAEVSGVSDVSEVSLKPLNLLKPIIYIICVKDDVIGEVAARLKERLGDEAQHAIVVHTAGTKPMSLLEEHFANHGVFYPMQTFSKTKALAYPEIPIFLEASNESTMNALQTLARTVFHNITVLSSEERKILHIAAVFSSNFTNHMVTLADEQLHTIGLDYTVMLPLLKEVTDKLFHLPPQQAQTGPAVRKDFSVVNEHISLISDAMTREIYRKISESIMR